MQNYTNFWDEVFPDEQNDAIIFYFAGHGSYKVPEENHLAGSKMEVICPYDDRMGVHGILDRTIACLMHQVAVLNGNNIISDIISIHSIFTNPAV